MIRRYFIAGILVWLPIWVTLLVLKFFVDALDKSLALLPAAYRPDALLGFHIPGLGVVLAVAVLFATGVLATNFIGRHFVAAWDKIIARIPLVRSIHSGVKQVLHTVLSSGGMSFRKVLLVQYPREGLWSLAFQTGSGLAQAERHVGKQLLTVFVPTTPNPTSGFILLVPREEAIELDLSVDAALKMVISLGVISPVRENGNSKSPVA